jgi:hypothetical protein
MRELIVSTLADEPGVEIVGEVADEAEIAERVSEVRPDLLVIALDDPSKRPRLCDTLLRDHPNCGSSRWRRRRIAASFIGRRSIFIRARLKRRSKGF